MIAVPNCERSAFLAVSLALPLADINLGIKAAARIPMMTMTISISINVNHFLCFKNIGNYMKVKLVEVNVS